MPNTTIKLALPKGRMQLGIFALLDEAGINVRSSERGYRPSLSLPQFETKLLKPQNIVEMLSAGTRDIGFAGADWVLETKADLVELIDTRLDPVRIVAAAPSGFSPIRGRPFTVASEYEELTKAWAAKNNYDARFVRTFGATEVFPPEDADCIVDNSASGDTLRSNGLVIIDEVMTSSTRFFANRQSLNNARKRELIEQFVLLLKSVLDARERMMVEMNVESRCLDNIIKVLPCMRTPTISPLYHQDGFAVKSAVPKKDVTALIADLKRLGATDIVISSFTQIIP